MRITIVSLGSRGDAQPYVALGKGLAAAGHQVRIATHDEFRPLVEEHGLEFAAVHGQPREILASELGLAMVEARRNPLPILRAFRESILSFSSGLFDDCLAACAGADVILYGPLGFAAIHIGEALGRPAIPVFLQPAFRTRAFPGMLSPVRRDLGPIGNLLSHYFSEQVFWHAFRRLHDRWRRRLGLAPFPFRGYFGLHVRRRQPVLYGFSEIVLPRPADWGPEVELTGYWFLGPPAGWSPPADLEAFLASGPPPVYVGFGSMRNRRPEEVSRLVLEALSRTGRRGVLYTGWGGMGGVATPPDVFVTSGVPHEWLFPRMAAVVHHGGAGTTSAALRSGVGSVAVPFFGDQPFWADRMHAIGAGPRPIPRRDLTAEGLASAIRQATEDPGIVSRSADVGRKLRAEDGVRRAVQAIERIANRRSPRFLLGGSVSSSPKSWRTAGAPASSAGSFEGRTTRA